VRVALEVSLGTGVVNCRRDVCSVVRLLPHYLREIFMEVIYTSTRVDSVYQRVTLILRKQIAGRGEWLKVCEINSRQIRVFVSDYLKPSQERERVPLVKAISKDRHT